MDFQPFPAPPSDHHTLNTGLGTENGVTAKGLIDGLNTYLAHLFAAVEGNVATVADEAKAMAPDKFVANVTAEFADFHTRVSAIEDAMVDLKKLVQEVRPMLEAFLAIAHGTPQARSTPDITDPVPSHPEQTFEALLLKEPSNQGAASVIVKTVDPSIAGQPRNTLSDMLAGISSK